VTGESGCDPCVTILPLLGRLVVHHRAAGADLARLRVPRTDVVVERMAAPDHFEAEVGPFRHYERSLAVGDEGDVMETIDFSLAVPFWAALFALPMRGALRRPRRRAGSGSAACRRGCA